MRIFEATREANLSEVSWLRAAMGRGLGDARLPQEIIEDLQLVLSEVATNIVAHGQPSPTSLGLAIDLTGHYLTIEITDNGGEFAEFVSAYKGAEEHAYSIDALSGRGLFLIRDALDRFYYETTDINRFIGWKSLRVARPTILIAEDTPSLRQVYCNYLRREYRTISCASLTEARAILKTCQIDLVLADFHLGDGVGTTLASGAETFGARTSPPVVLISGDQSPLTRELAMRFGAEFFVLKPVRRAVMLDTIALALGRATMREARLAQSFAREVDDFVAPELPRALGLYRTAIAAGTASTGGGDLVFHCALANADRIVLVDVMGHGVAAKAWAIAYAAIIRTLHQCHRDMRASDFLTRLAELAWSEPTLARAMATVMVVDLDAEGASIATAGHPSPLIVGEEVRCVSVDGPLLGVIPPKPYDSVKVTLNANERLVMFTDGIDPFEVAAGGKTPEWFQSAVLAANRVALDEAITTIREATEKALGPKPADDWLIAIMEKS
ncbi:MAG: SpoIIE family protein phosphatase [Methylocystis sp.]